MVNRDTWVELGNFKNEVDEVFRSAGYIRPSGANYLALSTTRRFPHSTFSVDERRINVSGFL